MYGYSLRMRNVNIGPKRGQPIAGINLHIINHFPGGSPGVLLLVR